MNEPELGWNGQGLSDALQPPEKKNRRVMSMQFSSPHSKGYRQLHRDTQMSQVKI